MADQAARDAAVVDHRQSGAHGLLGMEAADGELAGVAADRGGGHEVLEMHGARPFVVALHAGAFAGQHRTGQREAAALVAAGEAVAGGEHHRRTAPACFRALGIGDALDRPRGVLRFGGELDQHLGGGAAPVVHVEVGPRGGQQLFRRDAADRVFRHCAGHVDGTLGQDLERLGREIGRGDEGLALADEDTQAQVAALAAFELLAGTEALRDRDRLAMDVEGVGRIGAGGILVRKPA